eukprot:m51a1_g5831 hypothetical protein (3543) ;mRNA; r:256928-268386
MRLLPLLLLLSPLLLGCARATDACPYEAAPRDLGTLAYLGFKGETHFQGAFYIDFTRRTHDISFVLAEHTLARFHVGDVFPKSTGVDATVLDHNGNIIMRADTANPDRQLAGTLQQGTYKLRLAFTYVSSSATTCTRVSLEGSLVPRSRQDARSRDAPCPSAEQYPAPDFTPLRTGSEVHYTSASAGDATFNVRATSDTKFFKAWYFTVPAPSGETAVRAYELDAKLGFHFPTGGYLGLVLAWNSPSGSRAPSALAACVAAGNCTLGVHPHKNAEQVKVMIPPGDYALWLYQPAGQSDQAVAACVPFSLDVDMVPLRTREDLLTCVRGVPFPEGLTLGATATTTPATPFYYKRDVLMDLKTTAHAVPLTVERPVLFRAYVPAHRVDIDLKLVDSGGRTVAYSYRTVGQPDGIAVALQAGTYSLEIKYFGTTTYVFCETFSLEVSAVLASPQPRAFEQCASAAQSAPDLSPLATGAPQSLRGRYVQLMSNWAQRTVSSVRFSVRAESRLVARVTANALLGDMTLALRAGAKTVFAAHERDAHAIVTALRPGVNYTLAVLTPATQVPASGGAIAGFPSCAFYGLEIDLAEAASLTDADRLDGVHVAGEFNVPRKVGTKWASYTALAPRVRSLLRLFVPRHHLDIDVHLWRGDTRIDHSLSFDGDETIVAVLDAGVNYTAEFRFFHWTVTTDDPPCFTFNPQLAVEPWPLPAVPSCSSSKLLPNPLFPATYPAEGRVIVDDTFYAPRVTRGVEFVGNFTLRERSLFRAYITSSFLATHLALRLQSADGTSLAPQHGAYDYSETALSALTLEPGTYSLRVSEVLDPAELPRELSAACVKFRLVAGVERAAAAVDPALYATCAGVPLARSLNGPAGIHALSGQRVHVFRRVLANIAARRDDTEFTVTAASLYRIYIPAISYLDVDVWLRRGTVAQPGALVNRVIGVSEEMMYGVLQPGQYTLAFMYYGTATGMPDASTCPSYPLQMVVAPTSYYAGMSDVTQACASDTPPSPGRVNATAEGRYRWSVGSTRTPAARLNKTISFVVPSQARFQADLQFEFGSAGLPLRLVGTSSGGLVDVPVTVLSSAGHNRLWIDEFVPAGRYDLLLRDIATTMGDAVPAEVQCGEYDLSYLVDLSARPTQDQCLRVQTLPEDLRTADGGSKPYGGPQRSDGTIRMFGTGFFLSTQGADRTRWVRFRAPRPSYVRVFALAPKPNDLDFYLYRARNDTSSLVYSSLGMGDHESAIWYLEPRETYDLKVYAFRQDPAACNYYHFEFELATREAVAAELLCPATLPPETERVPPASAVVAAATNYQTSSDRFVLTQQFVEAHTTWSRFKYSMRLTIQAEARVLASAQFDFLTNDLRLTLVTESTGAVVATGVSDGTDNRNARLNFENALEASRVAPGVYLLNLEESLDRKRLYNMSLGAAWCQYFGMTVSVSTTADTTSPVVTGVDPATLSRLEPCDDLVLTARFNVPPINIAPDALSFLTTSRAALLRSSAGGQAHLPSSAVLLSGGTALKMVFSKAVLQLGATYTLELDADKFLAAGNVHFTRPGGYVRNTYSVVDCNCSSHGTCSFPGPEGQCVYCRCVDPWAGSDCMSCKAGYHLAGLSCVANEICRPASCSGHGTCTDNLGYVVCACDAGYASSGSSYCNACARGYAGYPACAPVDDSGSTAACTARPLPRDLNTVAYLGWRGRVHLSGEFHAELSSAYTDVKFALAEQSVFRAYIEPHRVDVDLWLYEADAVTGLPTKVVDYRISFYGDESLYLVLPGGTAANPARYVMRLRYWAWDKSVVTACDTFSMELSVTGVRDVLAAVDAWKGPQACTGKLPAPFARGAVISEDFTYDAGTNFSAAPVAWEPSQRPSVINRRYIWNTTFTVADRPGKLAVLSARAAFRYRTGQVVLLLERLRNSTSAPDACPRTGGFVPQTATRCTSGENSVNTNYFERILVPGSYALHIYEAAPQNASLAPCAPFEFTMALRWTNATSTLFNCPDAAELPATLNLPGYLSAAGEVHIHDDFVVTGTGYVGFTAARESLLRVLATDGTRFSLKSETTGQVVAPLARHVYATLPIGRYNLTVQPPEGAADGCVLAGVELAIRPTSSLVDPCAGLPQRDVVPNLGNIVMPYTFGPTGSNQSFPSFVVWWDRARPDQRVAQYSFAIAERGVLYTGVLSDFPLTALGLELYQQVDGAQDQQQRLVAVGDVSYNSQYISRLLEPGSYTLAVTVQAGTPVPVRNACSAFNFLLRLLPDVAEPATFCLLTGHAPPVTFDSQRFLQPDGLIHFAEQDLRVPLTAFVRSTDTIPFTLAQRRVFRAYVEPNDDVDIDLRVVDLATGRAVATGGNKIFAEETLLADLQPGRYALEVQYWVWDRASADLPECPTYRMQVAAVRPEALPETCRAGGDHWPPQVPKGAQLPGDAGYEYFSAHTGEELYFQQRQGAAREYVMPFAVTAPADVYAQTTSDFATSHVALRLRGVGSGGGADRWWYGSSEINRHSLAVSGLTPGKYELYAYEPAAPLDMVLGCARFSFSLAVAAQGSGYTNEQARLPRSLDSLAYLQGGNAGASGLPWVHVADTYSLWRHRSREDRTAFTLYGSSLVHALATVSGGTPLSGSDVELAVYDRTGAKVATSGGQDAIEVYARLDAGAYSLGVALRQSSPFVPSPAVGVPVAVELAIAGVFDAEADARAIPGGQTCQTTPPPSIAPDQYGYYSYTSNTRSISWADLFATDPYSKTLALKLEKPAVLFARTGYDFLYGRVALSVKRADGVVVAGTTTANTHELFTSLPAGDHTLVVSAPRSPAPFSSATLARCTPYSVSLMLSRNNSAGGECSMLGVVPWDLNRADGGSVLYGGPLTGSGSLRMYAEALAIPRGRSSDEMVLTLVEDSAVSVFASTPSATTSRSPLRVRLVDTNTGRDVVASSSSSSPRQHAAVWAVSPQRSGRPVQYAVVVDYPLLPASAMCPRFALQVLVEPLVRARQQLVCPATAAGREYPARSVRQAAAAGGAGVVAEAHQSAWSTADVPQLIARGAAYSVTVDVDRASVLLVDYGFHALVTAFGLDVTRQTGPQNRTRAVAAGVWRSTLDAPWGTSLAAKASARVTPGRHTLTIAQGNVTAPVVPVDPLAPLCYPFAYELQLLPEGGAPYVADVFPAGSASVDPRVDLVLWVTFSEPVYAVDSGSAADSSSSSSSSSAAAVCRAFFLQGSGSGEADVVAPAACVEHQRGQGAMFDVRFAGALIRDSATYRLRLRAGVLGGAGGSAALYVSTNVYQTFDSACNAHGNHSAGACDCDVGYAGMDCGVCDDGYWDAGAAGRMRCVPATACEQDTCGCNRRSGSCVPLGACTVNKSTGRAGCACYAGYAGAFCKSCAAGYYDWPACSRCRNGGAWSEAAQQCRCPRNYAGAVCDRCAAGYKSYPACTKSSAVAVAVTLVFVLAALAAAAAVAVVYLKRRGYLARLLRRPRDARGSYSLINAADGDFDDDEGAPELVVGPRKSLPPAAGEAPAGAEDDAGAVEAAAMEEEGPREVVAGEAVLGQPAAEFFQDSQTRSLLDK